MSTPLREARRALDAARLLTGRSFHREAVSRAYYAVFYAAREAVQREGSEPKTHGGVASEFGRLYVQTGRVPTEAARQLRRLASKRSDADYDALDVSAAEASKAVRAASEFVTAVGAALGAPPPPPPAAGLTDAQKRDLVAQLTREMDRAAEALEFEKAAELRDSIAQIEVTLAA